MKTAPLMYKAFVLKGAECSARGNNEHSSQPAQEPRNLNASKIALSNWISTYKIRF